MIYSLENINPRYLYSLVCENYIKNIEVKWGILFVACKSSIFVYPDSDHIEFLAKFDSGIDSAEVTSMKFVPEKDRLYAGYSVIFN
jgi:hypothetical protein